MSNTHQERIKKIFGGAEYYTVDTSVWMLPNDGSDPAKVAIFKTPMQAFKKANEYQLLENRNTTTRLSQLGPELLETLTELYNAIDCSTDLTPELMKKCAAVIKKATE